MTDTERMSIGRSVRRPWSARFRDISIGLLALVAGMGGSIYVVREGILLGDALFNGPKRRAACADIAAREGSATWRVQNGHDCVIEGAFGVPVTIRV